MIKEQIIKAAEDYINKWNAKGRQQVKPISHKFNLTGKTAGQFCWSKQSNYFRWNLKIAQDYLDDYLINTVGHEVAHLITHIVYPFAQPHGYEWKSIMRSLGLEPVRCHNYKATSAKTHIYNWKYDCFCGFTEKFTNRKFRNLVMNGLKKGGETTYICPTCKKHLNIMNVKQINQ